MNKDKGEKKGLKLIWEKSNQSLPVKQYWKA